MDKSILAHSVSCVAYLAFMPYPIHAQQDETMETVVVTGVVMSDASTVTADPKRQRQL